MFTYECIHIIYGISIYHISIRAYSHDQIKVTSSTSKLTKLFDVDIYPVLNLPSRQQQGAFELMISGFPVWWDLLVSSLEGTVTNHDPTPHSQRLSPDVARWQDQPPGAYPWCEATSDEPSASGLRRYKIPTKNIILSLQTNFKKSQNFQIPAVNPRHIWHSQIEALMKISSCARDASWRGGFGAEFYSFNRVCWGDGWWESELLPFLLHQKNSIDN